MHDERESSVLRSRRRRSSMGLSCCFPSHYRGQVSFDSSSETLPTPGRSPRLWFRSKIGQEVPEMKGRCRNLISRIGRHRRYSSADFSYDPLSYALNFEDEEFDDELPIRNFASRLPSSPPEKKLELPLPTEADVKRCIEMTAIETDGPKKRVEVVAEVKRSLEVRLPRAASPPPERVVSRPSREILVELC